MGNTTMVTREEAKQKWVNNFEARLGVMSNKMGDSEAFVTGVANYLGDGVSESDIRDSDAGAEIIQNFENNSDLSKDDIEQLVVEGVDGADTLEDAMSELADKWDSNYETAFTA